MIPGPGTLRRFGTSLVAAAAVALTLTGCAAGQHAQTAEQTPVVDGAEAMVGPIALRNISVVAPDNQVYKVGDSAALQGVIINTGGLDDQLVKVDSDVATSVQVGGGAKVDIKAGQTLDIGPSGGMIVLQDLKQQLFPAQSLPVTFTFAKAGSVTFTIAVHLTPTLEPAPTLPVSPSINPAPAE